MLSFDHTRFTFKNSHFIAEMSDLGLNGCPREITVIGKSSSRLFKYAKAIMDGSGEDVYCFVFTQVDRRLQPACEVHILNDQVVNFGSNLRWIAEMKLEKLFRSIDTPTPENVTDFIEELESVHEKIELLKRLLLNKCGFAYTCDTPGSLWLYKRTLPDGSIILASAEDAFKIIQHEYREDIDVY